MLVMEVDIDESRWKCNTKPPLFEEADPMFRVETFL